MEKRNEKKRMTQMKKSGNSLIRCAFVLVLFSGFLSCKSGIYYLDFKSVKKTLDTLVICSPYARIVSVNKGVVVHDSVAINKSVHEMMEQLKILDKKYVTIHHQINYAQEIDEQVLKFYEFLDKKNNRHKEIQTPQFIQEYLKHSPKRYFLVLFNWEVQNNYPSRPPIYIGSGPGYGTLMFPISGQNQKDLRLFVFDNMKQKVAYYNKNKGNVLNILRSLFYK
ncbi:MAG: hypothetical protein A2X08_11465 [Bacteroidetes bacterium GWA2_32_17]|nr:MAG: hypothetical protein A2X08_11465 [Bacteroidetes bacterium GWA2_32_17]